MLISYPNIKHFIIDLSVTDDIISLIKDYYTENQYRLQYSHRISLFKFIFIIIKKIVGNF